MKTFRKELHMLIWKSCDPIQTHLYFKNHPTVWSAQSISDSKQAILRLAFRKPSIHILIWRQKNNISAFLITPGFCCSIFRSQTKLCVQRINAENIHNPLWQRTRILHQSHMHKALLNLNNKNVLKRTRIKTNLNEIKSNVHYQCVMYCTTDDKDRILQEKV